MLKNKKKKKGELIKRIKIKRSKSCRWGRGRNIRKTQRWREKRRRRIRPIFIITVIIIRVRNRINSIIGRRNWKNTKRI
jgi:hypothetical protein